VQLWRDGDWHVGHMEQLLRIGEPSEVDWFLDELAGTWKRDLKTTEVWFLKQRIDSRAVPLHSGRFDKEECKTCRKNTSCQLQLFGGEADDKVKCLDAACFDRKLQAWLDVNWASCKENRFGTNRALVRPDYSRRDYESIWLNPGRKITKTCSACKDFATVYIHGRIGDERACAGGAAAKRCFAEQQASMNGNKSETKEDSSNGGPRVRWHGEHFRQVFYAEQVPGLVAGLTIDDPRRMRLALACFIYNEIDLRDWFFVRLAEKMTGDSPGVSYRSGLHEVLAAVNKLKPFEIEYLLAEASIKLAFTQSYRNPFIDPDRQAIADFLGVDFGQFSVSDEYLSKKTKQELVSFIVHESGLTDDPAFKEYLDHYKLTVEKMAALKKGDLIRIITDCGADLHGRLPREIADRPEPSVK